MRRLVVIFAALVLLLPAAPANAAAGTLDPGFGDAGKVLTDPTSGPDAGNGVALAPDGRIVVAGYSGITRYLPDGSLDPSFAGDGFLRTPLALVRDVEVLPDGRIVAALWTSGNIGNDNDFAAIRLLSDGDLDPTFGTAGIARVPTTDGCERADDVEVDAGGRVYLSGWYHDTCSSTIDDGPDWHVVRFDADGRLDDGFASDGVFNRDFGGYDTVLGAALQPDGKLLLVGSVRGFVTSGNNDGAILRLLPDGGVDRSFGDDGVVTYDLGNANGWSSVALQPDGRIVAVGGGTVTVDPVDQDHPYLGVIARYTSAGDPDQSFGDGGIETIEDSTWLGLFDVAVQADGKIVATGCVTCYEPDQDEVVLRRTSDGRPDTTFGVGGRAVTDFPGSGYQGSNRGQSLAVQADGGIVVTGCKWCLFSESITTPQTLTRYLPDDTVPPHTTIVSGPAGPTNDPSPTFTFAADEPASFQCSLTTTGDPQWSACASGVEYGPLTGGTYTFRVRATDTSGNVETEPATRSFQVDLIAPSAAVLTPVDGRDIELGTVVLADYFCGDEDGGSGIVACAGTVPEGSPVDTSALGPATFTVTARDAAGNETVVSSTYRVVHEVPCPSGTSRTVRCLQTGTSGIEYVGTGAAEHFTGTDGDDTVLAGGGRDTIIASAGNDRIDAGAGVDVVNGGAGDDTVVADDGRDVLVGIEHR